MKLGSYSKESIHWTTIHSHRDWLRGQQRFQLTLRHKPVILLHSFQATMFGRLENPGQLPIDFFKISSLFMGSRSRNSTLKRLQECRVTIAAEPEIDNSFKAEVPVVSSRGSLC